MCEMENVQVQVDAVSTFLVLLITICFPLANQNGHSRDILKTALPMLPQALITGWAGNTTRSHMAQ